jgi:predicted Zn-ribbon and HTH transcriptional regulator
MTPQELLKKYEGLGMFSKGRLNPSFIHYLHNRPELEQELLTVSPAPSLSEALYLLNHEKEKCRICGLPVEFKSYGGGYKTVCSPECRKQARAQNAPFKNPEIRAKAKETLRQNYGVENAFALKKKKSKPNAEKAKKTCKEKYGVEHPMKHAKIKQKALVKTIEKYGASCSLNNIAVREKAEKTLLEKYGVSRPFASKEIQEKARKTKEKKAFKKLFTSKRLKGMVTPLFTLDEFKGYQVPHPFKCNACGVVFNDDLKNGSIPRCPQCYPKYANARNPLEDEVADFIKSISPHENIVCNDRVLLEGKELDIYLPDRKLAIEFNELYWHSESKGRGKNYHLDKTKKCEALGIHLVHIFDDEWINQRDNIEALLESFLGVYSCKIGARNCGVREGISTREFLEDNHLQGYSPSSIEISLWYKDEMVACATFKKPRYSKESDWELIRFATKKRTHIVGALGKMLSFFRKNHPGSIVTYSDRRLFTGNSYRKTGFKELRPTPPDYWYTKNYRERESRLKYQKHKIPNGDPNLTERENMQLMGYDRIYGCGNWKFILE